MNLIFDLDGTLIDSKLRLHALFQKLAPSPGLEYSRYWELKRAKISNATILADLFGLGDDKIQTFVTDWMALIEDPEFLALDICLPGAKDTLERLGSFAVLHACTDRQHELLALAQLERLRIRHYFREVLVTGQRISKELLIRRRIVEFTEHDWIIGDTGRDVLTGRALGIHTCAVLSGFQSRAVLKGYEPDVILDSVVVFKPPFHTSSE
jgi:phosphoglycolate phosphatase